MSTLSAEPHVASNVRYIAFSMMMRHFRVSISEKVSAHGAVGERPRGDGRSPMGRWARAHGPMGAGFLGDKIEKKKPHALRSVRFFRNKGVNLVSIARGLLRNRVVVLLLQTFELVHQSLGYFLRALLAVEVVELVRVFVEVVEFPP